MELVYKLTDAPRNERAIERVSMLDDYKRAIYDHRTESDESLSGARVCSDDGVATYRDEGNLMPLRDITQCTSHSAPEEAELTYDPLGKTITYRGSIKYFHHGGFAKALATIDKGYM